MPTGNRVEDLIRAEFSLQEEDELLEELREKMYNASSYEEIQDIQSKILDLRSKQTDRYIAARGTEEAILEDADKVITAVSLEEWKNYLKGCLDHYNEELAARSNEHNEQYREAKPTDAEFMENLFEYTKDNIENFLAYLMLYRLNFQISALVRFTTPRRGLQFMLLPLAEKRYKEFCPSYEKQPLEGKTAINATVTALMETPIGYIPVFHGHATDALAKASSRDAQLNQITGNATIKTKTTVKTNKLELTINKWNKLDTVGINEHKLLFTGISEFTKINGRGANGDTVKNDRVAFPLKEYALLCGYKVGPVLSGSETPEEEAKELKRAAGALKEAKKKIKKSLQIIYNMSIAGSERVRGQEISYSERRLLSGFDITSDGFIKMIFAQDFANYLALLPIAYYPTALLGIDARNPNAYTLGLKMSEHFSNYNNQGKGTAQSLKVKTLLECTTLPDIETVRRNRNQWEDRIKEPLEEALETLVNVGVLTEWRYSKPKGEELTNKEATFASYEEWIKTLVYFTMKNNSELASQIKESKERTIERKAKAAEKAPKKKKSKK